ncbi:MAG: response regulator [Deltaproteobacteria bacterium]|nr:response regulator [Deltaproteobacteria bacterium]
MKDLKILFVDDDPVTRKLMEKKLQIEEYETTIAVNGVEAVDFISKYRFDVVLTDLMMPGGVDGIGVLQATKEKSPQTDVVLITAYASIDNAVTAMRQGAFDYLQKPINFDELFLLLDKISNLKKLGKAAGDLREAMDVTECNAAQTIQDLEMSVSELNGKISEISHILSKKNVDAAKRVSIALDIISAT